MVRAADAWDEGLQFADGFPLYLGKHHYVSMHYYIIHKKTLDLVRAVDAWDIGLQFSDGLPLDLSEPPHLRYI